MKGMRRISWLAVLVVVLSVALAGCGGAKKAKVEECYFDRGGFLFHGRVKALADAAREGGLKF